MDVSWIVRQWSLLVDAETMPKSKGNFLMMNGTVEKYTTTDATCFLFIPALLENLSGQCQLS
jgi:hypothetical protein